MTLPRWGITWQLPQGYLLWVSILFYLSDELPFAKSKRWCLERFSDDSSKVLMSPWESRELVGLFDFFYSSLAFVILQIGHLFSSLNCWVLSSAPSPGVPLCLNLRNLTFLECNLINPHLTWWINHSSSLPLEGQCLAGNTERHWFLSSGWLLFDFIISS